MLPKSSLEKNGLFRDIQEALRHIGLSTAEREETLGTLEKSIILNLCSSLIDNLPEKEKVDIEQVKEPEALLSRLLEITPQEKLNACLQQSTEEVVSRFLKKLAV